MIAQMSKSQVRKIRQMATTGLVKLSDIQAKHSLSDEDMKRLVFWKQIPSSEQMPVKAAQKATADMSFEIAQQIRKDKESMTYKELKAKYGKAESTLRDIVKGRTWKAVK